MIGFLNACIEFSSICSFWRSVGKAKWLQKEDKYYILSIQNTKNKLTFQTLWLTYDTKCEQKDKYIINYNPSII